MQDVLPLSQLDDIFLTCYQTTILHHSKFKGVASYRLDGAE